MTSISRLAVRTGSFGVGQAGIVVRVPRSVARFNRRFTNRAALRSVDCRLPVLGVLTHLGRKTGKRYRTPLLVFDTRDGFAILVGYGSQTHWVRNVLAGGEASIYKHGRTYAVRHPALKASEMWSTNRMAVAMVLPRFYNDAVLVLTRSEDARGR